VDHIIEVGGPDTLVQSLQAIKAGGTISLIGFLSGLGAAINPMPILFRAAQVQGIVVGSAQSFEDMNRALERYRLRPVIDEVFPLDRAREALAKLAAGRHYGKIVVRTA